MRPTVKALGMFQLLAANFCSEERCGLLQTSGAGAALASTIFLRGVLSSSRRLRGTDKLLEARNARKLWYAILPNEFVTMAGRLRTLRAVIRSVRRSCETPFRSRNAAAYAAARPVSLAMTENVTYKQFGAQRMHSAV